VKRFFVSEAQGAELKNLSEYLRSGTPGDWMRLSNARSFYIKNYVLACRSHVIISGASFWYFLREKALRDFMGQFRKQQTSRRHSHEGGNPGTVKMDSPIKSGND
jgi:hypothetical protein